MEIEKELKNLMGDQKAKIARALTEGKELTELQNKYGVSVKQIREWLETDQDFMLEVERLVQEQERTISMALRYGALLGAERLKDALEEHETIERDSLDNIKTVLSIYVSRKREEDKEKASDKDKGKSKGSKATLEEIRQTILGI